MAEKNSKRNWALFVYFLVLMARTLAASPGIERDSQGKRIILWDGTGNLVLRLSYDSRCVMEQVKVMGREVIREETGVYSGIKVGEQWFTTQRGIPAPKVEANSNRVTISGIEFGPEELRVSETWELTVSDKSIQWKIERTYPKAATIEDMCFPGWEFQDVSTWTGGLLGTGGVAWGKLFDKPNASYGVHNGNVTFWNKDERACLRITPSSSPSGKIAVRFSRQANGAFSLNYYNGEQELIPRHGLSRFRREQQDIWRPVAVKPGRIRIELKLSTLDYDKAYARGDFKCLDGGAIREICHTIGRIGVVDEAILGSNGYYSDVAVLHEPWLAQIGLVINDNDYCRVCSDTLDFQRRHAIGGDGRVKSRWSGQPGDELCSSYDHHGYYECQWGSLIDAQTSWVINVAEQFDFTGNWEWLKLQKAACEAVLDYLLRRDTDGNGLVKMMTDSHLEAKGSDWIDVVWAAYENALVNAQTYWALSRWAECEDLMGDRTNATRCRKAAAKLKERFNRKTSEGGFWDEQSKCYAYWRNKDGSVHGTNLVVPVNFSAIGYGLCEDAGRRTAILGQMEKLMEQEKLFFWPLCFFSYAKEEGHPQVNWPFPKYENGDLFLAWGELGTRAYAMENPAVALKYVKNVLGQYSKDGLAYQRYLRGSQTGKGDDILANNCSIIVGLYRNIYGLQPKYNRLYLEPHLTDELNGTRLNYQHRGKDYQITLNVADYAMEVGGCTVRSRKPFAINMDGETLEYFNESSQTNAMAITRLSSELLEVTIRSWPEAGTETRSWTEAGKRGGRVRHVISNLPPNRSYRLSRNGRKKDFLRSDGLGRVGFDSTLSGAGVENFELAPK